MNKEKMIQIVKEQLPEATSGASYYTRGNIPRNKFIYARNAFGSSSIEFEDVIGLTDETVFGGCERGFLFTFYGFYTDDGEGLHSYQIQYNSLGLLYNVDAFNYMLGELYKASEEEDWGDIVDSAFDSIIDFAGDMIEGFVENKLNDVSRELQRQQEEVFDETVGALEIYRTAVSTVAQELEETLDSYKDGEFGHEYLLAFSVILASELSGDGEFACTYLEDVTEDLNQNCESIGLLMQAIDKLIAEFELQSQQKNQVNLSRNIREYKSSVLHAIERSSRVERSAQILQEAGTELLNRLEMTMDALSDLIDLCYEQSES